MSELITKAPQGVLRRGWSTKVDDYAIAGTWACGGKMLVVGDAAGGVFGLEGKSGKTIWSSPGVHDGGLLAMDIHPGRELVATAGQDGRVLLWSAQDGRLNEFAKLEKAWVENVAWSPNGQWLAASNSRRVHVYDIEGNEVWQSEDHPSTVSAIAWAGSEELATACYGRVSFFEAASGTLRQKLEWKGSLVSMVLSPDGDIVACGSQDNSVHFWRRSTAKDSMMSGYPGKPSALAFDASGTLLATSGGNTATVWCFQGDGPEGTQPGELDGHIEPVTSLTFSKTGRQLATGGRDGAVVVWEVRKDGEGLPVGVALVEDVIATLAWRPDGRSLAALDASGGVTTWRLGG